MAKIRQEIPNVEHLECNDLSDGCGSKFDLIVVSSEFQRKPLLAQQRMVNTALKDEITHIHAITMKTKTPEQWAKMQASSERNACV